MHSGDRRFILTVTQLNEYVKSLLSADPLLRGLELRGEISNFKRHSSGHLYFSLKDAQSVVRCVMFRQNALALSFFPRDGQQVVLSGYASVYTRDGQYQFYCEDMQADGVGALYQQFERNKARFAKEGLFDEARKRPLPTLIRTLGVATSPTGAVIRDIIRVARRRNPGIDILLYPCKVQGEGAAAGIAAGVRALNAQGVDVIIVGRGGGSLEDLWAFNEEEVVRAVYASKVPVVSAVGHETDFALSDFAADVRASTPSNAAEICVLDVRDAMQHVDELTSALQYAALHGLERKERQLAALQDRVAYRNAERMLIRREEQVSDLHTRLDAGIQRFLAQRETELKHSAARLAALNPEEVLRRGYAVARKGGTAIRSVGQVGPGDGIAVRVTDGTIWAAVERIEEKHEKTDI